MSETTDREENSRPVEESESVEDDMDREEMAEQSGVEKPAGQDANPQR